MDIYISNILFLSKDPSFAAASYFLIVSASSSSSMTIKFEATKYFQIFLSVFFVGSYLKPSTVIEDK